MKQKRTHWLVPLLAFPVVGLFLIAREAASWRPQFVGMPHTDVYAFEISPDGRFAAIQGDVVELFELATGKETILSRQGMGVSGNVRFSPDGHYLAWCECRHPLPRRPNTYYQIHEDTIVVWDTVERRVASTTPVSFTYERSLRAQIAFNPNNVLMFLRGIKLLQLPANGAPVIEKRLSLPVFDQGLRLSQDGLQLLGVDRKNLSVIRLFDAYTLKPLPPIVTAKPNAPKSRYSASKMPGQNMYVVFEKSGLHNVYGPASSKPLWKFKTFIWASSPSGRNLIQMDDDKLQVRDSKTGAMVRAPKPLAWGGSYYTFASEPDESHILFYKEDANTKSGPFMRQRIQ